MTFDHALDFESMVDIRRSLLESMDRHSSLANHYEGEGRVDLVEKHLTHVDMDEYHLSLWLREMTNREWWWRWYNEWYNGRR